MRLHTPLLVSAALLILFSLLAAVPVYRMMHPDPGPFDRALVAAIQRRCPGGFCIVALGDLLPGQWDTILVDGPMLRRSELEEWLGSVEIHGWQLRRQIYLLRQGRTVQAFSEQSGIDEALAGQVLFGPWPLHQGTRLVAHPWTRFVVRAIHPPADPRTPFSKPGAAYVLQEQQPAAASP